MGEVLVGHFLLERLMSLTRRRPVTVSAAAAFAPAGAALDSLEERP
jgi:hypothetical protein